MTRRFPPEVEPVPTPRPEPEIAESEAPVMPAPERAPRPVTEPVPERRPAPALIPPDLDAEDDLPILWLALAGGLLVFGLVLGLWLRQRSRRLASVGWIEVGATRVVARRVERGLRSPAAAPQLVTTEVGGNC